MIILLNGPCGIGKSTIATIISKQLANCILIHGDDIYNIIVNNNLSEKQVNLTYKNILMLTENFIDAGFENIIIDFVFETPEHILKIYDFLAKFSLDIYCFRLFADIRENKRRNMERKLEDITENKRVEELFYIFQNASDTLGRMIDTTNIKADEVAKEIMGYICGKK